eukprot:gb/GFBE01069792.1/.p1 GENE.gb/GFBE01069792.1/~~gb/GFBE01069792.1/.p1  ORF type:complete len:2508 (+),score=606.03 gb/GFBE01069792.1/:1-7524(+)
MALETRLPLLLWLPCLSLTGVLASDTTPSPEWRPAAPSAEDLARLSPVTGGCSSIRDMGTCLSSKDAGEVQTEKGLKVFGEACVWCGGGLCATKDDSLCMAFDLLMHGEGTAFTSFHAKSSFKVAKVIDSVVKLPADWDISCLSATNQGCPSFTDKFSCLSSADGRPEATKLGRKVHGEPCVWCAGGMCNEGANKCEPYDWQMNGEGSVFQHNYASGEGSYTVARCNNGFAEPHPDATHVAQPPFPLARPSASQTTCLKAVEQGCFALNDRLTCLSSVDASSTETYGGLKIKGEPCVWCGGGNCNSGGDHLCAPFDYLEKGAGRAFSTLNAVALTSAKCLSSEMPPGDFGCLKESAGGCHKLTTYAECTSSKDGRAYAQVAGFQVSGQPCVWCGGENCHSNNANKCEPYDFLMNGEGQAYDTRNKLAQLHVAACDATGKVEVQLVPTAVEMQGQALAVDCGYPAPTWQGVSKTCGFCQVVVGSKALGGNKTTCAAYCAKQGLQCSSSHVASGPVSCDLGAEKTCSYEFSADESAVCKCDLPMIAKDESWKQPKPTQAQLGCLVSEPKGCSAVKDRTNCLSKKDGRPEATDDRGLKINGEPCVWCGGGACTSGSDSKCEAYDYLMNGEGRAFATTHVRAVTYQVATCHKNEDADFGNLQCLNSIENGCNSLSDEKACLSSVDGRAHGQVAGFKVAGQPCVWCGGGDCHSHNGNKCEPYDYVMNGEGVAFDTFHAVGTYKVAACENGKPAEHALNSGFSTHGTSLAVSCGGASHVWGKVSRVCGECQVAVPKITSMFRTCTDYCAHQPGAYKCVAASLSHPHSCDVDAVQTCDHVFEESDTALCRCAAPTAAQQPRPATQNMWAQCGGKGWFGLTVCETGGTCKFVNEYYSQCILADTDLGSTLGGDLGSFAPDFDGLVANLHPKAHTQCLKPVAEGCSSLHTKMSCLNSTDGRTGYTSHGLKVGGEPCVWCGGTACTTDSNNLCEARDWLDRGQGVAFTTFLAKSNHRVAQCMDDKDAIFTNLQCLKEQPNGCNSIREKGTCLASVDGRPYTTVDGFKAKGQPCVWCGGMACHSNNDNLCEPYDFTVNGQGHAFGSFYAELTYQVGSCDAGGNAVTKNLPDSTVQAGTAIKVDCGNPQPEWTGLAKSCGVCQGLVPQIETKYKTCATYCAHQSGGIGCKDASLAFSHSCETQQKVSCDHVFQPQESAVCHCEPLDKAAPTPTTVIEASTDKALGTTQASGPEEAGAAAAAAAKEAGKTPREQVTAAAAAAATAAASGGVLTISQQASAIGAAAGAAGRKCGMQAQEPADIAAEAAATAAKAAGKSPKEQVEAAFTAGAMAGAATGVMTFREEVTTGASAAGKEATKAGFTPGEAGDIVSAKAMADAEQAGKLKAVQGAIAVDSASAAARAAALQAGQSAAEADRAASAAAAKAAATFSPTPEPKALDGTPDPLQNIGADCWDTCDRKSGMCSFCGVGNACCRQTGDSDPPIECQHIPTFTTWHHECVVPLTPQQAGAAAAEAAKLEGKNAETQVTAALTAAAASAAAAGMKAPEQRTEAATAAGKAAAKAGWSAQQVANMAAQRAADGMKSSNAPAEEQVMTSIDSGSKAAWAYGDTVAGIHASSTSHRQAIIAGAAGGKVAAGASLQPSTAAQLASKQLKIQGGAPEDQAAAAIAAATTCAHALGLPQDTAATDAAYSVSTEVGLTDAQRTAVMAEVAHHFEASLSPAEAGAAAAAAAKAAGKTPAEQVAAAANAAAKAADAEGQTAEQQAKAAATAAGKAARGAGLSAEDAALIAGAGAAAAAKTQGNTAVEQVVAASNAASVAAAAAGASPDAQADAAATAAGAAAALAGLTPAEAAAVAAAGAKEAAATAGRTPLEQSVAAAKAAGAAAAAAAKAEGKSPQEQVAAAAAAAKKAALDAGVSTEEATALAKAAGMKAGIAAGMTSSEAVAAAAAAVGGSILSPAEAGARAAAAADKAGKVPSEQALAAAEAAQKAAASHGMSVQEQEVAAKTAALKAAEAAGLLPDEAEKVASAAAEAAMGNVVAAGTGGVANPFAEGGATNNPPSPAPGPQTAAEAAAASAGAAAAELAKLDGKTVQQQAEAAAAAAGKAGAANGMTEEEAAAAAKAAAMQVAMADGMTAHEAASTAEAAAQAALFASGGSFLPASSKTGEIEPLRNQFAECFATCGKAGFCDNFCGNGNACCRKTGDIVVPHECKDIPFYTTPHYECVVPKHQWLWKVGGVGESDDAMVAKGARDEEESSLDLESTVNGTALVAAAASEEWGAGRWAVTGAAAAGILVAGAALFCVSRYPTKDVHGKQKSRKADAESPAMQSGSDLELQAPLVGTAPRGAPSLFDQLDTNGDGVITRQEYARARSVVAMPAMTMPTTMRLSQAAPAVSSIAYSSLSQRSASPVRTEPVAGSVVSTMPAYTAASQCTCGNIFAADAVFCRKCGKKRPEVPAAAAQVVSQGLAQMGNIFNALDANRDGVLSPAEWAARNSMVRRY